MVFKRDVNMLMLTMVKMSMLVADVQRKKRFVISFVLLFFFLTRSTMSDVVRRATCIAQYYFHRLLHLCTLLYGLLHFRRAHHQAQKINLKRLFQRYNCVNA